MILDTGKKVLIRTVTNYYTGLVHSVDDKWIHLMMAAWIPDTGRFSTGLTSGTLVEVEPYPDGEVLINIDAVVDVSEWAHDLPRAVK